jgi:hypothetical protein
MKVKPLVFIEREGVHKAFSKIGFAYEIKKMGEDSYKLTITKGESLFGQARRSVEDAVQTAQGHNEAQVMDLLEAVPPGGEIHLTERIVRMKGAEIVPATKESYEQVARMAHSASYRKGGRISTTVLRFLDKSDRVQYAVMISPKE